MSRCLCGRGLRAALAFSFLSAPGRRNGCAATVTKKKEKAGWGVVVAVPKWSRSVQDSFCLPGIHLPFQPAPPILTKTLIIIFFFFLFAVRVVSTAAGLVICGEPDGLTLKGLLTRLTARLIVLFQALTALPPARVRNRIGARGSAEVCMRKGSEAERRRRRRLVKTATVVSVILEVGKLVRGRGAKITSRYRRGRVAGICQGRAEVRRAGGGLKITSARQFW